MDSLVYSGTFMTRFRSASYSRRDLTGFGTLFCDVVAEFATADSAMAVTLSDTSSISIWVIVKPYIAVIPRFKLAREFSDRVLQCHARLKRHAYFKSLPAVTHFSNDADFDRRIGHGIGDYALHIGKR